MKKKKPLTPTLEATKKPDPGPRQPLTCLEDIVSALEEKREILLADHVRKYLRLIRFETGILDVCLDEKAPRDLFQQLQTFLYSQTGKKWQISHIEESNDTASQSLYEQEQEEKKHNWEEAENASLTKAVLQIFPQAHLEMVEPKQEPATLKKTIH